MEATPRRSAHPSLGLILLLALVASSALAADPEGQSGVDPVDGATIPATPILGMAADGTAVPELVAELRRIQALTFPDLPLPMGVWFRAGETLFYSYVDSEAGPSVAGEMPFDGMLVHVITRTHSIGGMSQLTDEERSAAGLPVTPDWVRGYGPQPPRGSLWGAWRSDPRLVGRFHPDFPDDVQVWIYKGTLENMRGTPELVWVRLWSCTEDECEGRMLNEPFDIKSMHEGDMIRFGKDAGAQEFLVMLPQEAR